MDDLITDLILARLEEDDAADLLRPAPALVVDAEALRAERATLRRQRGPSWLCSMVTARP